MHADAELPTSPVPDRESLLEVLLIWAGVPTLIVVILMTVLILLDYLRFALRLAASGKRALAAVLVLVERYGPSRAALTLAKLSLFGGLLVALTYAIAQLIYVSFTNDLDSGRLYETSQVLRQVLTYDHWSPIASNAVLAALVVVVLVLFGGLMRVDLLFLAGVGVMFVFGVACLIVGVLAVIGGLCVLALGLAGEGGYTVEMSYFYGIWAAALLGWVATATSMYEVTDSSFRPPPQPRQFPYGTPPPA